MLEYDRNLGHVISAQLAANHGGLWQELARESTISFDGKRLSQVRRIVTGGLIRWGKA